MCSNPRVLIWNRKKKKHSHPDHSWKYVWFQGFSQIRSSPKRHFPVPINQNFFFLPQNPRFYLFFSFQKEREGAPSKLLGRIASCVPGAAASTVATLPCVPSEAARGAEQSPTSEAGGSERLIQRFPKQSVLGLAL